MALFNIWFRAHIFIAGIAVTYLAYGLTALLLKGIFGQDALFTSDTIPTFPEIDIPIVDKIPVLSQIFSGHTLLVYLAYALVPAVAWALYRTRWGLRLRVVGEAPEAAATAGVNVDRVKFQAMVLSGLFCGLGGAYLSLAYVTLFSKEMTNERGLIALAAIFFARGNPYFTALVALLFGAATALSVTLPQVTGIASQLLQMIPYVVTVLALVLVGWRSTRSRSKHRAWRFDLG
jgi:simple sugar transport system permease protein